MVRVTPSNSASNVGIRQVSNSTNVSPTSNNQSTDVYATNSKAQYYSDLAQQAASNAADSASSASESATNAYNSQQSALSSENNAHIWAEGDDEEVEALGGTHSSKGWVEYVIENAPTASVEETSDGAVLTVTDINGTTTATIYNGADGQAGVDGEDGVSPTASVTQTSSGATITVTDAQGTTTANLVNGTDGRDGTDGADGQDGFSPIATVSKSGSTATISITDANGTTTTTITDGTNGTNGTDGQDGEDGFSPTATVTKSGNTATITITDKNGTTTANVYDGTGGGGSWGSITGDIEDQTDLQDALDDKQDTLTAGTDLEIVEGSILPNSYTQLTSITSTGTQWINSGIKLTNNFKSIIVGRLTETPTTNFRTILGANNNNLSQGKQNVLLGWGNSANGFYAEPCTMPSYTYSSYPWDTNTHTFTTNVTPTVTTLNIDGVVDTINSAPSIIGVNLAIFARLAQDNTVGSQVNFELNSIELYQSGSLVFKGVPAKRNSDDEVGLYDTVSGSFFPNSGTGDFIAGSEVPAITVINFTNDTGYITSSALGNGTITITQGGVTKGTFTTNQSTNATIALDAGGSGGGSYSAGTGIDITNDTISIDTSVVAQLSDIPTNHVTTDTAQNISGRKTFLGEKAIYFKQSISTDKLGFTLFNSSDTELGALEYRPNTVGKTGALLNVNVPYSSSNYVGFRYWGTAVNIIAPKVATAGNYYIPTHITNGNTTVTANASGTVDISSLISGGGSGGIQNTATGTDSLTILGTATTDDYAVNIGDSSSVGEKGVSVGNNSTSGEYAVALGWGAHSNHSGVAIGGYEDEYVEGSATASGDGVAIGAGASAGTLSVAIGSAASDDNISNSEVGNVLIGARTSAENAVTGSIAIGAYAGIYDENNENAAINNAIQLGGGVNGTSNTFQVWEYPLLSYPTGLIPDARLSSNIARTSQIPTVPTLAYSSATETLTFS